jgi:hypothetical protein
MQTEARFRYATEWDGSDIPARSDNGTMTADFSDPNEVKVEIHAPEPVNKGVVSLTLDQLRALVAQAMLIEEIDAKNRKAAA